MQSAIGPLPGQVSIACIDDPIAGDGQVVIETAAAGLCRHDLDLLECPNRGRTPLRLGHEAVGRVVDVGRGVTGLRCGQMVLCTAVAGCGSCPACLRANPSSCEHGVHIPMFADLFVQGKLMLDGIVDEHYEFDEIESAFDALSEGSVSRGAIDFSERPSPRC